MKEGVSPIEERRAWGSRGEGVQAILKAKEPYRGALLGCHEEGFLVRRTHRAHSSVSGVLDSTGAGVQECSTQG